MQELKQFKIRASQAGKILTNPRTKTETLSATTLTYVKEWLKETLYKRRKQLSNKYMDKGNINEEDGVTLLALHFGTWLDTNTKYMENDWACGTCDINHKELGVWDIKNSYSLDTFPMFETKIPNTDYADQVNVYQELYDNKVGGGVAYVLTDMPNELLERELKWIDSDDDKQEKALNYIYTLERWKKVKAEYFPNAKEIDFIEIPANKRVKTFDVPYDEEKIKKLKNRVEEIRNFIKQVLNLQNK